MPPRAPTVTPKRPPTPRKKRRETKRRTLTVRRRKTSTARRGRKTLTRKPRVKREKKRKTVRARKRTRRMPNKNPLNQKPPCQTLTDTLTKLSKNSSHHTHHRNVLLIINTSYISPSPLTIVADTSERQTQPYNISSISLHRL